MADTPRFDSDGDEACARSAARLGASQDDAASPVPVPKDAWSRVEDDAMRAYEKVAARYREAIDRLASA